MAGKLIPLSEAAQLLGVSADQLNELRQNNEIHGYRDGASWKFKQEDVERLKDNLGGGGGKPAGDDLEFALPTADEKDDLMLAPDLSSSGKGSDPSLGSDVLREVKQSDSELTLHSPDSSEPTGGPVSDVSLASDVVRGLMGSSEMAIPDETKRRPDDLSGGPARTSKKPKAPANPDDEEFVLGGPADMEMDLTGSKTVLKSGSGLGSGLFGSGPIQLGGDNVLDGGGSSLSGGSMVGIGDEHDNVLGGSGSGSDITHRPGDSGILLIDPADSGLSLEAPPELSGARAEGTIDFQGGAEDDFLLKPLEEAGDEDSESGSQVIMLDTEGSFDEKSSTLVADSLPGMPGGLEMDFGGGLSGGGVATAAAPAAIIPPGMIVVPKETPFSLFAVIGLTACTLVLAVGGVMMFDLVRNIWSWDNPYPINSALMDSILGK